MRLIVAVFVVLSGVAGVENLRADSDGYYCVGKDYIAYQFGLAPPADQPHVLHIVRFDSVGSIRTPIKVILPNFQVHGMRCDSDAVAVASFDSVYTVPIGRSEPSGWTVVAHLNGWQQEWAATQLNLGIYSVARRHRRPESVELYTAQSGNVVRLELGFAPDPKVECYGRVTASIARYQGETRLESLRVFDGSVVLSCGG